MHTVELIPSADAALLVPLLSEAEEGDDRIARTIADSAYTAYIARRGEVVIGAVVMQWHLHESEIIYIATTPESRGQGYGKALIQSLVDEARRRGIQDIYVGTANSSPSTIAFYQKCGFRMDSVRRDFFDYLPAPVYEDGIRMRDMLVLRYALTEA